MPSRIKKWPHSGASDTLLAPDYDLLQAVKALVNNHDITMVPHHIKSHQDLDVPVIKLHWTALLNCDVDTLASTARNNPRCESLSSKTYLLAPGHRASLHVYGQRFTSHIPMNIREAS